jgi:DNA-binding response OmpR family regulator/signal transduction histidine kinase
MGQPRREEVVIREKILIVDDETTIQFVLVTLMNQLGHEVVNVSSAEEAIAKLETGPFALAMLDIVLPGMSGITLLGKIKELSPDTEVIMMTSHASIDTAIDALRKGAYDYIHKPFELDDVTAAVQRVLQKRRLEMQNRVLLEQQDQHNSELMQAVRRLRSLNAAGNGMSGIATLTELLDFFVGLVAEELDVERVSLMLREEEGDELKIAASRGVPDDVANHVRVKVGEGVSGTVAQQGEAILVGRQDSQDASPHTYKSDSFVSVPIVLSVPIRTPGSILGVINVTDRRSGKPFDEDDKAYMNALAGQAGVAIERARHSEGLRKAYENLRSAQDQVVASSRLKALGEMAAGVAHDFNNVLNGVLGRAQLIRVSLRESPPQLTKALEYGDVIEKLSVQGAETVRRIQEFARIRKDRPNQLMDLNQAVRLGVDLTRPKWSEESRAAGIAVEVKLELEDNAPAITGTPEEVGQIISNLIFNAVEAMPNGGRVNVQTARRGKSVCLVITDTGCGMTEETRTRLFEPFYTTKTNGQGLGMSVVYGIVQRMGGEIEVESVEGAGTTIAIAFPAQAGAPREAGKEAASRPTGKARIMVVDDDPRNVELCQDFLTHAGHEVVTANSGSEALIELREKPADLVVTDLSMPGMSGLELARTIRSSMPKTRVVILSGWAVQQDDQSLREAGVLRVLAKPIGLEELVEAVDIALAA